MWAWNGTSATELVAGVGVTNGLKGLNPTDMTVFGNEVLFGGSDSGTVGLWETNGTAAGTTEITGIGNMGIGGLVAGGQVGLIGSRFVQNNTTGASTINNPSIWADHGDVDR